MRTVDRTVHIPKFLWKLHGKQAYKRDLMLTYLLAIIVMLFNLLNAKELALLEVIVVLVLSVDVGGGVVSNFTKSTINYYKEGGFSPHHFIWFHALQTFALAIIYEEFYLPTAIVMGVAMAAASITVAFRKTVFPLQISVFLFAVVVLLQNCYSGLPIPLNTLIMLMAFKLLVGFAGHYGKHQRQ